MVSVASHDESRQAFLSSLVQKNTSTSAKKAKLKARRSFMQNLLALVKPDTTKRVFRFGKGKMQEIEVISDDQNWELKASAAQALGALLCEQHLCRLAVDLGAVRVLTEVLFVDANHGEALCCSTLQCLAA